MSLGNLKSHLQNWATLGLVIGTSVLVVFIHLQLLDRSDTWAAESTSLPAPQTHALPATLAKWQDASNSGDYFSEVKPTPLGYLVWSQLPVKVYVAYPPSSESSSSAEQAQQWMSAVLQAVQEWAVYLPLRVVEQPETADITISRTQPSVRASFNRKTGEFQLPRARSAETRYEFYVNSKGLLSHKLTIQLSPTQTGKYIQAAARHELGHALGIWGHSPVETDALYFSQVRNPPAISPRDVNTLKRVYQQPTQLGWSLLHK